jgi:hypothetical protein
MAISADVDSQKSKGRSRLTNGSQIVADVDGRSTWARRLRDLIQLHLADLAGEASEAERSIVRRAAALTVELERMETSFALAGEALPEQLDLYQRTANSLRRLLEAVGLDRRAKDITPLNGIDRATRRRRERMWAEALNGD